MAGPKYKIDSKGRECVTCKDYKEWNGFYKSSSGARGYSSTCRACRHDINMANNPRTGTLQGFDEQKQQFALGAYKSGT